MMSKPGPSDGSSVLTATNIIRSPVDTSMLVASSTQCFAKGKTKRNQLLVLRSGKYIFSYTNPLNI